MRDWSRAKPGEQGTVFLVAMVILTVLLFLGACLIERAENGLHRATVDNFSARSFHLAEAGIHRALWSLNQPNGWFTYAGDARTLLGGGYYEVGVSPPPAQRGFFTDRLTLLGTGYLPGTGGAPRFPVRIQVIAHKDPRYFAYAVFGSQKVTIGNGTVTVLADSYTTDNGGYGGANVAARADVGTNSTAAGAIEILPKGEVHGNITVGAGVPVPSACVSNRGLITGSISAATAPNALPSVTSYPPGAIELGDIWLDSTQELVLNEGVYHMTDLDMFGSSKITCNGKVVIYLDESTDRDSPEIRIGGNGLVNTSGVPSNLALYCLQDVVDISISGNGNFCGGIYAPQAAITLNSGQVYGSLVGNTVTLNGATASVHYDEALRDHSVPQATIRSWQEL
jgi:hypothetical protein